MTDHKQFAMIGHLNKTFLLRYLKFGEKDECEAVFYVQLSDSEIPVKLQDDSDHLWSNIDDLIQADTDDLVEYKEVNPAFYESRMFHPKVAVLHLAQGEIGLSKSSAEHFMSGAQLWILTQIIRHMPSRNHENLDKLEQLVYGYKLGDYSFEKSCLSKMSGKILQAYSRRQDKYILGKLYFSRREYRIKYGIPAASLLVLLYSFNKLRGKYCH